MIKYPLGIQSFNNLIQEGYLYVDKTALIEKLIEQGKWFFLSRPRRFGKSLLISTLQSLFNGDKALFEGLHIAKCDFSIFKLDGSKEQALQ
ncbi:MAG: AAA family ATPase, partial [Alteromonadaceae bacterium]